MESRQYDYSTRKGILPISWEDFHGLCKALAKALAHWHPEIVLPVARGGLYPGGLIAHLLQAEVFPIRLSRRVNDMVMFETPQWLLRPPAQVHGRKVVIVDEISDSGETLLLAKVEVESLRAMEVRTAVLYAHSWGTTVPDYIGLITDALILNPWDREILQAGEFKLNPEYERALASQGIKADGSSLIKASHFEPAKAPTC